MHDLIATVTQGFPAVFRAIAVLFAMGLVGFVGARRGTLTEDAITALTKLIVDVLVPAALISGILRGLDPSTMAASGVIILAMLTITFAGLLYGFVATRLWSGADRREDNAIVALSAFQNGLYLPLPLALALTPPEVHARVTVYVSAAVLVLSSTQWSIGVMLLRRPGAAPAGPIIKSVGQIVSPPVWGIVIGVTLAAFAPFRAAAHGGASPLPVAVIVQGATMLGQALPPLAMVMLGMLIGRTPLRTHWRPRALVIPALMRYGISPLLMGVAIKRGWLPVDDPLVGLVLMAQAASPSATNLSIAARRFGGDWEMLSAALLPIYLLAMALLPIWVALAM